MQKLIDDPADASGHPNPLPVPAWYGMRPESLRSCFHFLGAFLRAPLTVGSFWPSSSALSRLMVASCEFPSNGTVVELGPGTGNFTKLLLERLSPAGRFLAVEINQTNVDILRRRFPKAQILHDSAENLRTHLEPRRADCVACGLAWGNMLPETQDRIFSSVLNALAPGGQFVTFAYVHATWFPTSLRFRQRMFRHFAQVETTRVIWKNMPPAFVYRCRLSPQTSPPEMLRAPRLPALADTRVE